MRRWILLVTGIVLLFGASAVAWAQDDPSPTTTTTTMPPTTIPPTTTPSSTSGVSSSSGPSSTDCVLGTTTTYCFPVTTPTTQPASYDCEGHQVTTRNPAKYAEKAQQVEGNGLTCFTIRLTDPGRFLVSASGDTQTLRWLFG